MELPGWPFNAFAGNLGVIISVLAVDDELEVIQDSQNIFCRDMEILL